MLVKGTAFLARRTQLVAQFGERRWQEFFAAIEESIPSFSEPIVAVSSIPVEDFLEFSDRMIAELFDGDERAHWQLGIASADWAMSEGPYSMFFESRDVRGFLRTGPQLWRAYYSESDYDSEYDEATGVVDGRITGLPVTHVHFELNVMGYMNRSLELVGAEVLEVEPVTGPTMGDRDIHYRFRIRPRED